MHACVYVASETTSVGSERSSPRPLSWAKTPGGAIVARLRSTPSARPSAPTLRGPPSALRKVVAIASLTGSTDGRSTCRAKIGGIAPATFEQAAERCRSPASASERAAAAMAVAGGEESSRPEGSQRAGCWSGGVGKVATSRPLARQSLWRPLTRLDRPRRSVRPRSGSAARACRSPRR